MEFDNLNIWKKGYELVICVYEVTSNYPKEERYGLVNQTRRAANSIIALIAESHGRYSFADKIRVLYQARGEAIEVRSHLKVAHGLGFLLEGDYDSLDNEYKRLSAGINAYIKSISKHKK